MLSPITDQRCPRTVVLSTRGLGVVGFQVMHQLVLTFLLIRIIFNRRHVWFYHWFKVIKVHHDRCWLLSFLVFLLFAYLSIRWPIRLLMHVSILTGNFLNLVLQPGFFAFFNILLKNQKVKLISCLLSILLDLFALIELLFPQSFFFYGKTEIHLRDLVSEFFFKLLLLLSLHLLLIVFVV